MASVTQLVNSAAQGLARLTGGKLPESVRQQLTGDSMYCRDDVISFFELKSGNKSFLYPLVHGLLSYQLQEPFAVSVTPGLFGGLGVDEQGIIQRRLIIQGQTTVDPAPLPIGKVPTWPTRQAKNYADRGLPKTVKLALSGQRHFQYLNDEVFRAYSELKRDVRQAERTFLFFHNPREGEHWRVAPANMGLSRSAASPNTYPFSLDLIVLGPAEAKTLDLPAADQGLIGRLSDAVGAVTGALASLSGAVDDLTRLQSQFRLLGQKVIGIVRAASNVLQAAQGFLDGTTRLLRLPLNAIDALFSLTAEVCATYGALRDAGLEAANWPDSVLQRFRAVMRACDQLLVQAPSFDTQLSGQLSNLTNQPTITLQPSVVVATTFDQVRAAGTARLAGTAVDDADAEAETGGPYLSVFTVIVRKGDSLAGLAARHLGSPTLWRDIARLNLLRPPWAVAADAQAVPPADADSLTGSLTYGTKLFVPSTQPEAAVAQNPAVLGPKPTVSADEQALGRDLALVPVGGVSGDPLYDFAWTGGDMTDLVQVVGADAVAQSAAQQVVQVRGGCAMAPDIGMEPIIGSGVAGLDASLVAFRVRQQLSADPRVAAVTELNIVQDPSLPDTVRVDATLALVQAGSTAQVQLAI